MTLGQMIRKRREEMGLTLDQLAAKTEFSKPYLSIVETGKTRNPPSDTLIFRIERVLNFQPSELYRIAHYSRMTVELSHVYATLESENRHYKEIIQKTLQGEIKPTQVKRVLAKHGLDIKDSPSTHAGSWVPIINNVSGGYSFSFDDFGQPIGFADNYIRCPDIQDTNAFAIRVVGDLMEPEFSEGDIVLVSSDSDVNNGDDCFVRISDRESTFSRVYFEPDGQIRLQPRNIEYSTKRVERLSLNGIYRAVMHYQVL